jgi:hypothetical protein
MILTNSEIGCYQRCPREWQHRYVDHRTGPSTPAQGRGTRIHAWLGTWWLGDTDLCVTAMEPVEQAMVMGYAARWTVPHLTHVRTSVPFSVELPNAGVTLIGELDGIGIDPALDLSVIVEHKSTTQDISPGSQYWNEKTCCDPQVSTYLSAFPDACVLYDVLRVPALRPLEANSRRKEPETEGEYVSRCLAAMAEEPDRYFQRAHLVRLESERDAFERDVEIVAESMVPNSQPRNPKSCFSFGRRCDFFGVCWNGVPLSSLEHVELNHTAQVKRKLDLVDETNKIYENA